LVWITTRIALSQSTRNLGDIVVVATAANISRRSGGTLRRKSAAARMLGLRIRVLPVAWMSVVIVVCCQVEVSASG